MKKLLLSILIIITVHANILLSQTTSLFFSEYIEGSSNNRALEIYNGTGAEVDLTLYQIAQSKDGLGWQFFHTFPAGSKLANGAVWVIINNASTLFDLKKANESVAYLATDPLVSFTGNDARAIIRIVGKDTTVIDVFGDPKSKTDFNAAGVASASVNHTLIRKTTIKKGNSDWAKSAGTNADDSEWIVLNIDDFSNLGVFSAPIPTAPKIFINEFLAKGLDAAGVELSDWLELYNPGTAPVNVGGMYLTDNLATKNMWQIPTNIADKTTIPAKGFLIIYADEKITETLHSNFKFSKQGEAIGLYTADGLVVDTLTFGEQNDNISQGRFPDGSATWQKFETPTPGAANVMLPSVVTIYKIQYTTAKDGNSPYLNKVVTTSGIVTGIVLKSGALSAYYIQDGTGIWNGLYIFDNKNSVTVGDKVTLTGTIAEYFNLTELQNITAFKVESKGNALPAPVIVTGKLNESHEGILVKAENITCFNTDFDTHKNSLYKFPTGSDTIMAHTQFFIWTPALNSKYTITGVVNFDFSDLKVEPRDAADIIELTVVKNPPVIGAVLFDPASPVAGQKFTFAAEVTDDVSVASAKLSYGTSATALTNVVALAKIGFSSNYGASLTIAAAGTIYYKIEGVDDAALTATKTGSFVVKSPSTGIETMGLNDVKLYPNPVIDVLHFDNISNVKEIQISNVIGQTVKYFNDIDGSKFQINTADMQKGIYLVSLKDKTGNKRIIKIIKK